MAIDAYPPDRYPVLSLYYWKAVAAFGQKAVDCAVGCSPFTKTYPHLKRQLQSTDLRTKIHTLLTGETTLRIAGCNQCIYDFLESPEGDRLTADPTSATPVGTRVDHGRVTGWVKIDRQDALRIYGGHALFSAVDRGVGYKREHDYDVDWHRRKEALRLTVIATKPSFVLPGPVLIWIRLRNTAAIPIRIYASGILRQTSVHPMLRHVTFILILPTGNEVRAPITEESGQISYEEGTDIQAGQAATQAFDLASVFRLEKSGRYKFLATCNIASDSNCIEFHVHYP